MFLISTVFISSCCVLLSISICIYYFQAMFAISFINFVCYPCYFQSAMLLLFVSPVIELFLPFVSIFFSFNIFLLLLHAICFNCFSCVHAMFLLILPPIFLLLQFQYVSSIFNKYFLLVHAICFNCVSCVHAMFLSIVSPMFLLLQFQYVSPVSSFYLFQFDMLSDLCYHSNLISLFNLFNLLFFHAILSQLICYQFYAIMLMLSLYLPEYATDDGKDEVSKGTTRPLVASEEIFV